jgi:hypothetical protein
MTAVGESLDLGVDPAVFEALAALGARLASEGGREGPVPTLSNFLGRLALGDRSALEDALAALGQSTQVKHAGQALEALRNLAGCLPSPGVLACRWDDVAGPNGGCRPLTVALPFRLGSADAPRLDLGPFLLVPGASARVTFDAAPALTDGRPSSGASSRIELTGCAEAKTGARIPLRLGVLGLDGQAGAALRVEWLVDRGRDRWVAQTFAAGLGVLASPFHLSSLAAAFAGGRLRALRVCTKGAWDLAGSLQVGLVDALTASGLGPLGVDLSYSAARRASLELLLYPMPDDEGAGALRLDLRRAGAAEDRAGVAAGLSLDVSATLEGLRSDLLAKTGQAQALLAELQDFIPASRGLGRILAQRLAAGVAEPGLATALAFALGDSAQDPAVQRLVRRLQTALDAQPSLWQAASADLAGRVTGQALVGLTLVQPEAAVLRGLCEEALRAGLDNLRENLRQDLAARLDDPSAWGRLVAGLSQAGAQDPTDRARVEATDSTVRAQLDRFQGVLGPVAEAIRRSGESKLLARWQAETRRNLGRAADLSLRIDPGHPQAAELYGRLALGDLDSALAELKGTQPGGGPGQWLAGMVRDSAHDRNASGVELTLLDFRLGQGSLMDSEVFVETDAAGNIRVCTRGEAHWSQWRPSERSDFAAVDVFELATAGRTRHLTLSLSLSQVHKDLEDREIRDFFRGLADPGIGLLGPERVDSVLARLPGPPAAGARAGELRAWLDLDEVALSRLLRLPGAGASPGAGAAAALGKAERQAIYVAAVDALVAGLRSTGSQTDYRNLLDYLGDQGYPRDLSVALKDRRFAPQTLDDASPVDTQPFVSRLKGMVERADRLCDAIAAMREIYLAGPGPGWGLQDYRRRQREIDGAFVYWARGVPLDRGWGALLGGDSIGPYLLALFKGIADLCRGPDSTDAPPLRASVIVRQDGQTQEIDLIDQVQPPADAPLPIPAALLGPAPAPRTPESRTAAMTRFIFPFETKVRTYHTGGRRFSAQRPGRLHAGCDLIAPKGTRILAMADGEVRRGPAYFYEGTYSLEVVHYPGTPDAVVVRYGEIGPKVPQGIGPGKKLKQGDLIAEVGRLNSGSSMLHLEMFSKGADTGTLTQSRPPYQRRADLIDPTDILDAAPTWSEVQRTGAPQRTETSAVGSTATSGESTLAFVEVELDPFKVPTRLRARKSADVSAPVEFLLAPDARVQLMKRVTGGLYPFGDRNNLWLKIRQGDKVGYIMAWFAKDQGQGTPPSGISGPSQPGYVADLQGTLNIHDAPQVAAPVVERLTLGTPLEILAYETGGTYASTRNDWLRVRTPVAQEGYAAACYVAIGKPPAGLATGPGGPAQRDRWERAIAETQWAGASDKTAGAQLGPGARGGPAASEALARQDLERVGQLAGLFQDVGAKFGIPAALLAGIASRESHCGRSLDRSGWGDRGNGFGIMQVDKNAHPHLYTADPKGVQHIEEATGIFAKGLGEMLAQERFKGWEDRFLLQGAVAAYNFGLKHVRTREHIDEGTSGGDYGSDTLARTRFYMLRSGLDLLRA